jgi:DNA-binding MarR family transcriptional regulator
MKNKYTCIKELIDLFGDYEGSNRNPDLLDFAYWMINHFQNDSESTIKIPAKSLGNKITSPSRNQFDDQMRFLEATARISRYHEFYVRKYLKDLVINTRLEFLFLQSVHLLGSAKKTDLINMHHLEYTTGMDTIRRLINNSLLTEIQDETDRRIKLLKITDEGREVYEKARKRIKEESSMFFTAMNENKWKKALPVLEDIDDFHNSVYQKHSNKPVAELGNLMDSLKHLFK